MKSNLQDADKIKGFKKNQPKSPNRYRKQSRKQSDAGKIGNKTVRDYQDVLTFDLVQHHFDNADDSCKSLVCLRERQQWKKYKTDW